MSEPQTRKGEARLEVHNDGFKLDGRIVSDSDFSVALADYASIRLIFDPKVSYERVGKAIYTAARVGVLVNIENPIDQ